MKKISTFITAVFFLMAAALGWFIPLATFNVEDKLTEGKHQKLDIEKINDTMDQIQSALEKLDKFGFF